MLAKIIMSADAASILLNDAVGSDYLLHYQPGSYYCHAW